MEKLRVCLVSYEFPPFGGGEGRYTHDLMEALKSLGNEVHVITSYPASSSTDDLKLDQSVIHVGQIRLPGLRTTSFMLRVKRRLKELSEDIDIIHYTNDYCGFAASRNEVRRPVFATIHHTHAYEAASVRPYLESGILGNLKFSIDHAFLGMMEKSTLQNADKVIAVSRFTADSALRQYPFLNDKIRVVLNAVDEKRFSPDVDSKAFRKKLNLSDEPIVLYVGRLVASKGVQFLVESFQRVISEIPDAKLVIVGSGEVDEERNIRSRVKRLNLESSVILAGCVKDSDLPEVYAASDLVALPSLVEGFGLVLLEGMATGKPVVATKVGPIQELVDGREGILVPRADSGLLAEAIITILSDRGLAKRLGSAGRRRVEKEFSLERWGRRMVDIYCEEL